MFFLPLWGPHADKRMIEHNISHEQIAYTWLFGEPKPADNGYWRLVGEEVTLLLNPEQTFIVTLYPNKYYDRYTARSVRVRRADGNVREEWYNGKYDEHRLRRYAKNGFIFRAAADYGITTEQPAQVQNG